MRDVANGKEKEKGGVRGIEKYEMRDGEGEK